MYGVYGNVHACTTRSLLECRKATWSVEPAPKICSLIVSMSYLKDDALDCLDSEQDMRSELKVAVIHFKKQ